MRTALVTGANRGLGRAVATRLSETGHRVVVAARSAADASRAAASLPGPAVGVALDVTDPSGVRAVRDRIGPVDILVNNAGVLLSAGQRPSTVSLDAVRGELETNTLGSWRVSQAFLPDMVAAGWGRVVMVSSGAGSFAHGVFAGTPGYSLSKAALNALTVLLATETRDTGVLVNAVNPGRVRTRMMPAATTTPEDAAADVVWAATLADDGPTGTLLRGRRPVAW